LLRPNGQEWFETFGTDPLTGVVAVSRDLPGGLRLGYASDSAVPKPIVTVETTWTDSTTPTGPLTVSLIINNVTHSTVVLSHVGLTQGTPLRISMPVTQALASGKYDAQVSITAPGPTYSITQTVTQRVLVEDRSASPFGRGWTRL
jgi:hypothetical protein